MVVEEYVRDDGDVGGDGHDEVSEHFRQVFDVDGAPECRHQAQDELPSCLVDRGVTFRHDDARTIP